MKIKILLFSFLFFTLITHAQDSTFQLKDYKYRTNGYRALSLNLNLSGGTYSSKFDSANNRKSNSFSLDGSPIIYNRIVSTEKRQHTSSIGLTPYFRSIRFEEQAINGKERTSQLYFSWYRKDRFYGKHKLFFEVGNTLNSNLNKSKKTQTIISEKANDFNINDELSLGFGKGRIEYVQDAQMALFIINDLKNQGLITGNIDAATAYQFAQLITDINNKRIFDNRRRRIYELTQINNFLKEKGIISEPDIRHFTTINDNWALSLNPFRASGSAWFVRTNPKAGYSHIKRLYENGNADNYNSKLFGIAMELGFENYKPINLKWQRNYSIKLVHDIKNQIDSVMNGSPVNRKIETKKTITYLNSSYGIGFYPNNRTRLNAEANLQTGLGRTEYFGKHKLSYINPSLNFSTDYFLSFRTRLNASVNFQWGTEKVKSNTYSLNPKETRSYFNFSIIHSFF